MKISKKNYFLFIILAFAIAFLVYSVTQAYKKYYEMDIRLINSGEINPEEKIEVYFSVPVSKKYLSEKIILNPRENFSVRWEKDRRKVEISPEKFWKPGEKYEIIFPQGKSAMFLLFASQKFIWSVENYPEVAEVIPKNLSQNVSLDIEEPIVVNFKNSTRDFFIKFDLNPKENLRVENNLEKTQFKLMPEKGASFSTKYNLDIYAKYEKGPDQDYKKIYEGSFVTAPPPKISWEKSREERLEQAKRYIVAKIFSGKYIDINLEAQIMTIFENGKKEGSYLISSRKRGMETPKGETKIYNKANRPYSRQYGLYMPYWMALAGDGKFGIHELPEWPGGYKEGANHLGIPVSHGCVRLGVGAAEQVFAWAEIGTPVVIY